MLKEKETTTMSVKDACDKRVLYRLPDPLNVNVMGAGGGGSQYQLVNDSYTAGHLGNIALVENGATGAYDALQLGSAADTTRALRVTMATSDVVSTTLGILGNGAGGQRVVLDDSIALASNSPVPGTFDERGIQALTIRNDAGGPVVGDGDYGPLQTDNTGALRVTVNDSSIVHAEDAPHTSGDDGTMSLAVRNDFPAAVLAGTTGDYIPLTTDEVGNQRIGVYQTYDMALRRGLINGHVIIEQNGVLNDLDTSVASPNAITPITVWPGDVEYTGWNAAPEALLVVSTAGADAGLTVQLLNVLDSTYTEVGPITLTVGGAASGAVNLIRCHSAQLLSGTNIGTVSIRGATSGKDYVVIHPRKNYSTQFTYTVPTGKTLYMQSIHGSTGLQANATGGGNILSRFVVFGLRAGTFGGVMRERFTFADVKPGGPFNKELNGLSFSAETDIQLDVIDSSNNRNDNMYVTAGFTAYLIDD